MESFFFFLSKRGPIRILKKYWQKEQDMVSVVDKILKSRDTLLFEKSAAFFLWPKERGPIRIFKNAGRKTFIVVVSWVNQKLRSVF